MRGLTRLKRYYQKAVDYIDPKAVILMYHRVAVLPDYIYPIAVSPEHFQQHIKFLQEACQPISLEELALAIESKSIPRGAVVVTFDDGYADNYLNALPILEEFQVPATIFVSSGYIDGEREYWWDELERIFLSTESIPDNLKLSIRGEDYEWTLGSMEKRRAARQEIHRILKPLVPREREAHLESLAEWSGVGSEGREIHRSMTAEELQQLANNKYIQIGGHTVLHPQLAALPEEKQRQEIEQGCQELTAITGKTVTTFSYPYGEEYDYSPATVEIVRSTGFLAACTTQPMRVSLGDDLFRLPRFWVGDSDLAFFRRQLAGFFNRTASH